MRRVEPRELAVHLQRRRRREERKRAVSAIMNAKEGQAWHTARGVWAGGGRRLCGGQAADEAGPGCAAGTCEPTWMRNGLVMPPCMCVPGGAAPGDEASRDEAAREGPELRVTCGVAAAEAEAVTADEAADAHGSEPSEGSAACWGKQLVSEACGRAGGEGG